MHHASRPDGLRLQRLKSNSFKVTFRIGDRRYRFADGRPIGLPCVPIAYRLATGKRPPQSSYWPLSKR